MKPRDIALALAAPILWGIGFTFAKPALQQFPPMLMMVMIYLATSAMLLGRKLKWDPVKEQFADDSEANSLITPIMRARWKLS